MFWIIPAVGVAWVLISSLNKKRDVKPKPELPKPPPAGPGIERHIIRQFVKQQDGSEILLSEVVKHSGVDEQGQLVDEQEERFITLSCEHVCRGREGYGGRCRRCGATHCTLAECSSSCVKCGESLTSRIEPGKR